MHEKKEIVILDFDGTIADSLLASLGVLYEVTHHAPLPKEDITRLRGMTAFRIMRELKVPLWRSLFLLRKARTSFMAHIGEVALVPGVEKVIRTLSKRHKLFILTSNNESTVRIFLRRAGLETCFAGVYGEARPWKKERALRRLMRIERLDASEVWYVGDGVWDVRAAHAAGIRAVAVAWGFSNIHVLKRSRPEALVFTPEELICCFNNKS